MDRFWRTIFPLLLLLVGLALLAGYVYWTQIGEGPVADLSSPLATDIPLPTRTLLPQATATPFPSTTPAPPSSATPTLSLPPPTRALTASAALPLSYLDRFGVTGYPEDVAGARAAGLTFGHYAHWRMDIEPPAGVGAPFWQMIRMREQGIVTPQHVIDAALADHPGTIWLISNEPDVKVQANVTPARYAELYYETYTYIKERDPTALVAIGGVTQPTLLRRTYLDQVLDSYRERYGHPLPVDIWNVHAFILREERDSWGAGIPPGLEDDLAMPYELVDHDNFSIFRQNIIEFRAWMAERGYRDRPLLISEYGILMPNEYGFPPEAIADFMRRSFDFFLTARNETGYPADDNRLVQWWFWFIVSDQNEEWSSTFLYDVEAGELTALGRAYTEYVIEHAPPD